MIEPRPTTAKTPAHLRPEASPLDDINPVAVAELPTRFGNLRVVAFTGDPQAKEHLALVRGDIRGASRVPVRVHSECLTGDVLGSLRCDCGEQLIEVHPRSWTGLTSGYCDLRERIRFRSQLHGA